MNQINHPIERRQAPNSAQIMKIVILTMLPTLGLYVYLFGFAIIIQLFIATLTALFCEFAVAKLKSKHLSKLDIYSGILTAWILAFCLPATSVYWLIIVGVCFSILLAKHCFGGVGMNIFNPAIVGFCFVYISFAYQLSLYPLGYISFSQSIGLIFQSNSLADIQTGATLLALVKANADYTFTENTFYIFIKNPYFLISISWFIGGFYLWFRKIADWRLSISFLISYFIFSYLFLSSFSGQILNTRLFIGATFFCACYIITDPTTAPSSVKGRVVYAILIAFVAVIIKRYSQMPDSIAFAVLIGNLSFPLIDEFTKTKYALSKGKK